MWWQDFVDGTGTTVRLISSQFDAHGTQIQKHGWPLGKTDEKCLTGSLLKLFSALEDDSEDLDAFVALHERNDIQFREESLKCSWDICMQEVLTESTGRAVKGLSKREKENEKKLIQLNTDSQNVP